MRKVAALLSLVLSLIAFQASAVPVPMSPQQLVEASDLVALVRVVSVTCTGIGESESGKPLHSYSAQLKLVEIKKGGKKPGDVITTSFREVEPRPGAWSIFYYPGEEVWTHLVGGPTVYEPTWWNARGATLKAASVTDLPQRIGETVSAE